MKYFPFLFLLFVCLFGAQLSVRATVVPQSIYSRNIARQVTRVHTELASTDQKLPFRANWQSLAAYRTPNWFRNAKFGIFIHWGVYSVPAFGNEWYSRNMYIPGNPAYIHQITTYGPLKNFGYKNFIPMFRGQHFDPNAWVNLFVHAGARYVVIVGEHCDGFAMYASAMTPYNAKQMGPHRDVVGELEAAVHAHGLRFGISSHTAEHWWWYGVGNAIDSDVRNRTAKTSLLYGPAEPMELPPSIGSPINYTKQPNPNHLEGWLPPNRTFLNGWLARSTELVDLYHPDLIYFDWWIGQPAFKPYLKEFAAYYYDRSAQWNIQPVLTYKEEAMPPNTATLDIERGKLDTMRLLPWQTDTSISIHSWGYVAHDQYRTASSLIQELVDVVSKNGNLLLNIGPEADGVIPEQEQTVLLQMGAWLRVNGAAIYGTRPFALFGEGPTMAPPDSTKKGKDIQTYNAHDIRFTTSEGGRFTYAIVLGWPKGGALTVRALFLSTPYLANPVCSAHLLGYAKPLTFTQDRAGLHLALPISPPSNLPAIAAYAIQLQTQCTADATR